MALKSWHPRLFPRAQSEYFKRGITWSEITGRRFGARLSPGGFIFDVKGSSAFPTDIPLVLGLLNSSFANYVLELVNPTISFQVGDVARIPVPIKSDGTLRGLVDKALCCAKSDSAEDETTYDFMSPPDWPNGGGIVTARHQQLARMEHEIDEEVYRLYEISAPDRKAIEAELAEPIDITEDETSADTENESAGEGEVTVSFTPEELAKRWLSYSVGIALGRFQPGMEGALGCGRFSTEAATKLKKTADPGNLMVIQEGHPNDLAARVVEILRLVHGDAQAEQIIHTATGVQGAIWQSVKEYLLGSFFREHVRRYRKRPIYWLLQSPDRKYSAYLFHERATNQTLAILQSKRYLGGRIHLLENELQEAKRKEAGASGREKAIWAKNARELAEELEDLKAFDHHLSAANNVEIKGRTRKAIHSPLVPRVR